jgi:hypothetical protein
VYLTRVNGDFATVHAAGQRYSQVLCSKSQAKKFWGGDYYYTIGQFLSTIVK